MSFEGTTTPKAQDTVRCERFVVGSRQHSCIASPAPLASSHPPCAPAALRPSSIACAAWSCGTASPSHVTREVQDLCVVCEFGNRDQVLSMIHNPDVKDSRNFIPMSRVGRTDKTGGRKRTIQDCPRAPPMTRLQTGEVHRSKTGGSSQRSMHA